MLFFKKVVAWGLSIVIAFVLSLATVYPVLGSDLETYSMKYFILTVISFAGFFIVWIDYVLGAEVMPD